MTFKTMKMVDFLRKVYGERRNPTCRFQVEGKIDNEDQVKIARETNH